MKTNTETPAVLFFREHAGWSYQPTTETPEQGRMRCAKLLADAEARASAAGVQFRWQPDGMTNREWEKEGEEHGTWECLAYHHGAIVGSLSGVDFGSDGEPWGNPYARVVQAEIASEWENYAGQEPDDE